MIKYWFMVVAVAIFAPVIALILACFTGVYVFFEYFFSFLYGAYVGLKHQYKIAKYPHLNNEEIEAEEVGDVWEKHIARMQKNKNTNNAE